MDGSTIVVVVALVVVGVLVLSLAAVVLSVRSLETLAKAVERQTGAMVDLITGNRDNPPQATGARTYEPYNTEDDNADNPPAAAARASTRRQQTHAPDRWKG